MLSPVQIKSKSFESRQNSFLLPGADAPHAYVRAWKLCCFPRSYEEPTHSGSTDSIGGQLRGDKAYPFSGVTSSAASLEEGAGKRCSECGGVGGNVANYKACEGTAGSS